MRERTRRRVVAEAKSHRATPEELREAPKRVKELEQELLDVPLTEEAKQGESREHRYARLLRLRAMREDFASVRPPILGDHANGLVLSVVMTIASFLLCTFCAGGVYVGLLLLNQKPNPTDTGAAFWQTVEARNYDQVQGLLSPTERVTIKDNLVTAASDADENFGFVTNAVIVGQPTVTTQSATIQYDVTRGSKVHYKCTLRLVLRGGTWQVDDVGATFDPVLAGLPAPNPTAAPSPSPTNTPTQ